MNEINLIQQNSLLEKIDLLFLMNANELSRKTSDNIKIKTNFETLNDLFFYLSLYYISYEWDEALSVQGEIYTSYNQYNIMRRNQRGSKYTRVN